MSLLQIIHATSSFLKAKQSLASSRAQLQAEGLAKCGIQINESCFAKAFISNLVASEGCALFKKNINEFGLKGLINIFLDPSRHSATLRLLEDDAKLCLALMFCRNSKSEVVCR